MRHCIMTVTILIKSFRYFRCLRLTQEKITPTENSLSIIRLNEKITEAQSILKGREGYFSFTIDICLRFKICICLWE